MDCACYPPRNLHHQDCLAKDATGKAKEGPSEEHVAADGGERTQCRSWERPETAQLAFELYRSNGRTDRSGGTTLPPYTPPGVIGMSE